MTVYRNIRLVAIFNALSIAFKRCEPTLPDLSYRPQSLQSAPSLLSLHQIRDCIAKPIECIYH